MALTKAWYTALKNSHKVGGKTAPETAWEVALEAFEDARIKLAKAPTSALCDAALKALKTMKDKAKESGDALEAKGFKDVAKEVYASLDAIKKEKTAVDKIQTGLGLAQVQALAANAEEATYDTMWLVFEGQRGKLAAAPSVLLFKTCKATLEKLDAQATVCGQSSAHLLGKFNKQSKLLASIEAAIDARKVAYLAALGKAAKDRTELLKDMTTLVALQTGSLTKLNTVHTAATAAVTAKNSFELTKFKKAAKLLGDDAADKHTASTGTFAPGTTIRDSLDLKAAKIHSDESLVAIKPLSDKIFTENKALLGLDKQIKQVAADVAALKIT